MRPSRNSAQLFFEPARFFGSLAAGRDDLAATTLVAPAARFAAGAGFAAPADFDAADVLAASGVRSTNLWKRLTRPLAVFSW